MEKRLTYSVVERKDPTNPESAGKFYAQAQARGVAGIKELSKRIEKECTVTRADVMAVLIALEDVAAEALSNGEIVRLGELGSLQVSLSSNGTDTKELYNDSHIRGSKILFRSGDTLANMLSTLKYQRVLTRKEQKAETEEPAEEPDPLP